MQKFYFLLIFNLVCYGAFSQITVNINSGNPNFPFPQFKSYAGATNTLANSNPVGVPHAEMEQRIRDAYTILCNNMTYNVNDNGTYGPVTVAGVKYIMPNQTPTSDISHCTCVEGDGYYLLAAAYMGDKPTFDGYFMWMHDRQFQKTQRFIDCVTNSPGYNYSPGISGAGSAGASTNVRGGALGGNSATDGDVDVALALLVAWKQWGDAGTICTNPCTGSPVTYKTEAIKYIKTMVDTLPYAPALPIKNYITGVIGLDGYHKGGDSWNETTNWASGGAWMGLKPQTGGPQTNYVDYAAPAYFRSFSDMLTAEGESSWCIEQYKRAEASDDWLIGQAYAQGKIPWAGQYSVTGTTANFTNFSGGEDFRWGWRTILNYMWNGAPNRTWDPTSHTYTAASNTYEYDMAVRFGTFLKKTQAAPYSNTSQTANTLTYCGPPTNLNNYNTDGTGGSEFPLNWIHGTGSPAAVVSQDVDVMAQMFREAVIRWDQYDASGGTSGAQQYLTSKPRYFHEWFRLLGMLVTTGNYHDPMDFASNGANMKVYKAVNRTYAAAGDTLTYTISYRNYSKTTATSVVITDNLPSGLSFISATGGGTPSGSTVTWNIGSVPGFVSGGLAATMGSVTLKVLVTSAASGRLCNVATISCSNGTGWTSNEYPNNDTDVMERNCVDIMTQNPLSITKTGSRSTVMVGDSVSYTIVVKNQQVPFLNGGRPGVVVAGGNSGLSASGGSLTLKYRIYHGAHEPYINYKNYRVSYFLNKPGPPVWVTNVTINEGVATAPTASQQTLTPGATWNHRFLLTFPNQKATITPFLYFYSGQTRYIHEGATVPQRLVFDIHDGAFTNYNWTTDWSAEAAGNTTDASVYFPIANDWTDPLSPNQPVTKYHPNNCTNNVTTTLTKQLVEEWDGYTWRRIYGDAPVSGRDLSNIITRDTLPAEVVFGGFFSGYPTGTVSGNVITWPTVSQLKVNDSIVYKFWVTLKDATYFGCPSGPTPATITNRTGATADNEPKALASATTNVSCTAVTTLSSSMKKTANASTYSTGSSITYTIGYKNLEGTLVNSPTVGTDWQNISGGTMSVNGAGVIDLNTSWVDKNMYYKYSHGKDGYVKGTFALAQYQEIYAIILRYNGTTWTEVRFKVQGTYVDVAVFNMPANTQIGATQPIPYTTAPGAFDFQLQLSGNTLNVWAVNSGSSLPVLPHLTFTGLTVQAGYAGVRSKVGQAATLSNWYTDLDSGFNLQMTDPIPSDITYVSAANASLANCPSCGAGPYSGSNLAGVVTWGTIAGPVLANDSITYTWTGTVASCSGTITNTAYMKIMGVSPDPAGQVTVGCNTPTPVTLVSFEGDKGDDGVLLKWITQSEFNNDYFIVERSENGKDFLPVGKVDGNGTSSGQQDYSLLDKSIINQVVYYRLNQVDIDGSSHYSQIIVIYESAYDSYTLYPNPFQSETILRINASTEGAISIRIRNATGALIFEGTSFKSNTPISLGKELASGMYILEFFDGENVHIEKLIKQ